MKSLLIDNWTIEKAVSNYYSDPNEIKRLICFMALWDDVYYLDNGSSVFWKERVECNKDLNFILNLKPLPINKDSSDKAKQIYKDRYTNVETDVIARGALEYLIYAETNDIHYAPVDERARFIEKTGFENISFSRNDILKHIDEELLKKYERSARKIQDANIELGLETLISLINREKHNDPDLYDKIVSFKNKPMIKKFREWADCFEKDIRDGKDLMVDDYLNELKEIQNDNLGATISGGLEVLPIFKPKLQISFVKNLKTLSPKFMFPCYLYKKGINNSKSIVFPHRNLTDAEKNDKSDDDKS